MLLSEVFCCYCRRRHARARTTDDALAIPFLSSGRVGQDPVPEDGDPGADARQVGLGAPDAPADDSAEEPAAVFPPDDQRPAGVALKLVRWHQISGAAARGAQ